MMHRRALALLFLPGLLGIAAACSDDSTADANGTSGGPTNGFDASTSSPDGATSPSDGGTSGADAGPETPQDPFQAQWPAAPDFPTTDDYVVDATLGVVHDKHTGLLWTRSDPPDAGDSPETQVAARAACGAAAVGGGSGWRLPTRIELLSILTLDESHTHEPSTFDKAAYDNLPLWVATDDTTRNAYYEGHYHVHSFRGNLVGTWASGEIHCVKAPYPVLDKAQPVDPARFAQSGKVLVDRVTKLEWFSVIDNTSKQWTDAQAYCADLANAGVGAPAGAKPWRLPTLKEAASLWNETTKGLPTQLGASSGLYIWTASKYTPPPNLVANPGHFRIHFEDKSPSGDFYWDVDDFASTACVRDGS